jgi:hypothetical protein
VCVRGLHFLIHLHIFACVVKDQSSICSLRKAKELDRVLTDMCIKRFGAGYSDPFCELLRTNPESDRVALACLKLSGGDPVKLQAA